MPAAGTASASAAIAPGAEAAHAAELDTAYTDTLGDLVLGPSGSCVAATLGWWAARRRRDLPEGFG